VDDRETGNAVLANLCALNVWANLTLIDACAEVEDARLDLMAPGEILSLRHALWQLIEREHQFVAALDDASRLEASRLLGAPRGALSTLRVHAIDSGEALTAWAEEVDGDPMLHPVWEGQTLNVPASILVGEALLVAAGQRRRIQDSLRHLGITPPDLSALTWWTTLRTVGPESATI
jgi:hypothetical protein